MRIAVCDDNPKELERIKGCFCRIQGYDLVCSYFDSTSTVMEILKTENSPYDLYILDIEMPGMNGLKLAKSIREKDSRALFVFLTSYTRYMKDVFDVVTFDFIEKPISDEKLLQILERAATYLNITSQHFSFGYRASRYSLKYDRILYIEKKGRQALIHTFEDVYKTNMTLEEIWKQLNPSPLCISTARISSICITLTGRTTRLPLCETGRNCILQRDTDGSLPCGIMNLYREGCADDAVWSPVPSKLI